MLGQVAHRLLGVLVEQGVMLHDEDAVMVLLQYGHELEGGEGPPHIQLGDVPVQPAEDAGVIAADEEDLIALQFRVAVDGAGQDLAGGDQDAEGIRGQGDGRVQFDFHVENRVLRGYHGEAGGGAKVSIYKDSKRFFVRTFYLQIW